VPVVVVVVVLIVYNTGVWGIGYEVHKKPSARWKVMVTNWFVLVMPMGVMVM
jgi:hypothetical protein